MSKLYIFGIGGTGARVLRSFTMMMAAGVKIGEDEIVPIIIDPDASNADLTRTVALMNNYRSIRSSLNFNKKDETIFFRKELSQILVNYTLRIQDTDDKTFQEFIDLPSMEKSSQAMMRMLFSERNLCSSMDVGFKGNPNIGSIVLNQIVDSNDFMDFANNFESGDKIFIISSIFGGTGASGFPLLLKTLRKGNTFPNNDIINNAEIGAITILPYFKLKNNEESEIDSSTFISKTKSALAAQTWAYSFGTAHATFIFINKDGDNAKTNLSDFADIISYLPKYLRYEFIMEEDGKITKMRKSATKLEHPVTHNKIIVKPKATSYESALGIGRGLSAPFLHFDEVEFTPYIDVIVENSVSTFETSARVSREKGALYGRIFTLNAA